MNTTCLLCTYSVGGGQPQSLSMPINAHAHLTEMVFMAKILVSFSKISQNQNFVYYHTGIIPDAHIHFLRSQIVSRFYGLAHLFP